MIFAIAVDTSIGFRKDVYYFRYKGVDFKYVPHYKKGRTDDLVCKIPSDRNEIEIFELMNEFLSGFAFANYAKVIAHPGLLNPIDVKLNKINISYSVRKSINITTQIDEFYKISILRTAEQVQLARIYREAYSSNNIYLQILFFWHCLVYPSVDDNTAVIYIDKTINNLPSDLESLRQTINRIRENKIFLTNKALKKDSIGIYIKNSIRHSIAHIVRRPGYGINLQLDSLYQLQHLYDIGDLLDGIARYRLENEYNMKASNDLKIFRYIDEDELK